MFRSRIALALLIAVAILPLVGCANGRCCGRPAYAARPVYADPCCPTTSAAPPVVVGH